AKYLDRIVVPDACIARIASGQGVQEAADAGTVHLDAEVVARGIVLRRPGQGLTVAEADLEHAGRRAAEQRIGIAAAAGVVDPEARPVFRESALLRGGYASL